MAKVETPILVVAQ